MKHLCHEPESNETPVINYVLQVVWFICFVESFKERILWETSKCYGKMWGALEVEWWKVFCRQQGKPLHGAI
jgi:hypothetical protein